MISEEFIRERVTSAASVDPTRVHIRADPFGGWKIVVMLRDDDSRRSLSVRAGIMTSLGGIELSSLRVLADSEAEAQGFDISSFDGDDLEDLPLWPERLAASGNEELVVSLPSQSLEPLGRPVVTTFYSLRGGVGRSTALAHVARMLSQQHSVVCVDMDLEAPGLASLFDVEQEVRPGGGVVDLLMDAEVSGNIGDVDDCLVKIGDRDLYLLPAGVPSADYAQKLSNLDPAAWFREEVNPIRLLMSAVKQSSVNPDIVLIDSRTGISPISAPLLFEVADVAVIAFFPHPQARKGTEALTRALLGSRNGRQEGFTPEPRFIASPVPGPEEIRRRYEDRAVEWLREWLSPARTVDGEKPFDDVEEILHVVPYAETLATSDAVDAASQLYAPIAGWIAGFVGPAAAAASDPSGVDKLSVLNDLKFSTGTAEEQSEEDLIDTFIQTDTIARALRPDVPLVIGRKGTGKTAIFRLLSRREKSVVVTSPAGVATSRLWNPDPEMYVELDRLNDRAENSWRSIWPCLVALSIVASGYSTVQPSHVSGTLNVFATEQGKYTQSLMAQDVGTLLEAPGSSLAAWDWLQEINSSISAPVTLLFDGLDTGFGIAVPDLERRRNAISGLLEFYLSRELNLSSIKFKIMLREDIWRQVQVPNKSHLYSRQVRLAWSDQADYLRVAVKQAMRSGRFRQDLERRTSSEVGLPPFDASAVDVAYWPESLVYDAWTYLAGERVSGGKTAFTYNWVWTRLSDANENHSPRSLLQLLNEAVEIEQRLHRSGAYDRSIIRPRALVESLDVVSDQAIEALREEFQELEPVFRALEDVGRTPFDAEELTVGDSLETLAREVGLLGVDLRSGDDVERYRVPELYRKALQMTRRGQA